VNHRYRYRTSALVGRWRATREKAIEDAVNAKQARQSGTGPNGIAWVVPGTIEEAETREGPA